MIFKLLAEGEEHARTAKELAEMLNCSRRDITKQIEKERRAGYPICSSCRSDTPGYYIPIDEKDLSLYCDSLKRRAIEIFKTRQALVAVLRKIQETKEQQHNNEAG